MKKLLSLLFAVAIVFSLATRALAQPDDPPKGQATGTHAKKPHLKKKKHHKKKLVVEVKGEGSMEDVNTTSLGSNAQPA
jgi:hypothetical protein